MTPARQEQGLGRGPRSLLGSALAAAAVCGSLLALDDLIEPGDWKSSAVMAVLLLAALTAGIRAAGRAAWVPSAVAAVTGVAGLVMLYGGSGPGVPTFPTPEAIGRTWQMAGDGVRLVQESLVPMPAERPGELLVVAAAMSVFLLVDALALGSDAPALAALPLITFWLPAVFLGFPTNGWALFWTGLAYLLLLALSVAPSVGDSARTRQLGAVVGGAVAALVLAIVAGPVLSSLPAWAAVSLPDLGPGAVGPLQLSGDLDLRDSLGTRSGQTVLTYTVSQVPGAPEQEPAPAESGGPAPTASAGTTSRAVSTDARTVGPLRAFTVDAFDGRSWHRTPSAEGDGWDQSLVLGSGRAAGRPVDPADPRAVGVQVHVEGLEQADLPISTFPRAVQVAGPWAYDQVRDEVVGSRPTTSGLEYSMQVLVPELTADALRDARVGTPPGDVDYLAVPDSEHIDDVTALAAELTAEAQTPYAKAMALQSFLRSTANFEYDTRVPPATSEDAVWDFLQDRRGYCVQFATAMAIMARTLDIPTRVAIGFLPGEAVESDGTFTYVVTGKQAHAWPELYFEGFGWVRFEPTPAEQTGLPPLWSDPLAGLPAGGPTTPDFLDPAQAGADPGQQPANPVIGPGVTAGSDLWLPLGLGVAVLALLTGAVVLLIRRARRPVELTCEHAWHQLRRALARHASISWSDATTPRAAVRTVRQRVAELSGSELDSAAADALDRLARAVEQERYAPSPASPSSGELHHWMVTVRHTVQKQVSDRSRRGGGPSALPSES